jgi:hypothetical protein
MNQLGNRCSIRLSYRPLFFIGLSQRQVEVFSFYETVALSVRAYMEIFSFL